MKDLSWIPDATLVKDREDSVQDIKVCEIALAVGVTQYSGGLVKDRLDKNKGFIEVIDAEIARRVTGGTQ